MTLPPGTRIEGYEILGALGEGAQASVYRVRMGPSAAALKLLAHDLARDEVFRRRFELEAAAVRSLDHPAVVRVHATGEWQGRPFIVMDLLEGGTLEGAVLAEGGIHVVDALSVVARVAEALDHAHGRGVVHRDVKPANVLLDEDGTAYLTDFGLAKLAAGQALTRTGMWVGTLDYIAPEQIRAGEVGPAADVYALAALAYEALTGRPPFVRRTAADLLTAHLEQSARPPSALRPEVAGADAVLARGLAKDPARRYASAGALAHALRGALAA
jgi:serine/threonine-protein kinase